MRAIGLMFIFVYALAFGAVAHAALDAPAEPFPIGITCPKAEDGKTYAIFGRTKAYSYDVGANGQKENLPNNSTEAPEQFCVLVSRGQTTVSANALTSAGVLNGGEWSYSIREQIAACRAGDNYRDFDDLNRQVVDAAENPVEMMFEMKQIEPDQNCRGLGKANLVFRYEILKATAGLSKTHYDAFNLYFLGFSDGSTNEIKPCEDYTVEGAGKCNLTPNCFWQEKDGQTPAREVKQCKNKLDRTLCPSLPQNLCGTKEGSPACAWNATTNRCLTALEQNIIDKDKVDREKGSLFQEAIPDCAYEGTCNDTNDILRVAIVYSRLLFGIFGALALVFFIAGGVMIVSSFGNSEKVKKGQEIITAAIIGLIICFSSFMAINFLLDTLDVQTDFRAVGKLDE